MSEQSRKVLALALGVSFFALIVVLAAFFLFSPGKGGASAPFSVDGKTEARQENPSDYLAGAPQDSLTTQTTSAGDIIIVYGNEPPSSDAAKPSSSSPTTIVVSPSTKSTSPASATPAASAPAMATPAPVAKPATPATTAQPKPTTTTVAKPVAAKPAAAAPAAPTTTKSTPASGDYWIQAGSFSVRTNADALKALFEQKDLPVAIQVKEVDGKSRYNVRVGPYPSRAEASKWLSAAKSVKGAEQSWITQ